MFLMLPVASLVLLVPAAQAQPQPTKLPSPVNILKKTGNCGWLCQVLSAAPERIFDPATTGVPACYVDASTERILVCFDWNHPKAKPKNYVAKPGHKWVREGKFWKQVPRIVWVPIVPAHLPIPLPIPVEIIGLF